MAKIVGVCPICGEILKVVQLKCKSCKTSFKGSFELCDFCKLNSEQKQFVRMFLKNRGSIKEMEKDLGVSYPTVRNKLDEINAFLGLE